MVCSSHLKAKYVRFLIQYHLFIFIFACIMTSISITFLVYKYDQIHTEDFLRGFQAHGTKTSDDYRKLIALIRETQITHFYPHPTHSQSIYQQTPYPSFNPHINPCKKRFYLSSCPILPYVELTFQFHRNKTKLFDDVNVLQSVCKLEWSLRARYTNCSSNSSCCQLIGPVGLLLHDQLISSEQCNNLTADQLHEFQDEWSSCYQSSCENSKLQTYLTHIESLFIFKIYLSMDNDRTKLLHLYDNLHRYQYEKLFSLKSFDFDHNDEEILLKNFFWENASLIYLTLAIYILCLFLFVKNFFFIFIVLLHICLTFLSCFILYYHWLHLPLTILNLTSLTLYLFIVLIDAFLWYACWFINNHRRDDCTIQRIIENLVTQTFFYLIPKNLTAIIALVITYTNQIIAIQYFTVFAFLLISISFFISFTLYPASFVFILRYQASIPTLEHLSHRFLVNITSCFLDRTVPCLIIRLKAFWLTLLTILSCAAFVIIFQWPKLQYDVCRLTFQTLPSHLSSYANEKPLRSLDIDITYYVGSAWETPNEPLIPLKDIPKLEHLSEDRISSTPDQTDTFVYALKTNLSQLIQFCSLIQQQINQKNLVYRHYQRHVSSQMSTNNSLISSTQGENLLINQFHCFGDLSFSNSNSTSFTHTKFSPYIQSRSNQTTNCTLPCSSNSTDRHQYECILCLNSNYYLSHQNDDLFLIKNGLRFINDVSNPRYLLQTINYQWLLKSDLNTYLEWKWLTENLKRNFLKKFYSTIFNRVSFWYTSEIFSTLAILEQLENEKYFLMAIKFVLILIFLILFTGVLGIFVTLTTLLNFLTCIATLTLIGYKLTVENISYFIIVLIVCSQYSVLYAISYKLAPTFFFQRENRTMYSLKQLCTTLFHLTFSIILICSPCLFSSLPYLSKSAMVYIVSSFISLIYSTLFLQSLLCYVGPAEHAWCFLPWRLTFTRNLNLHTQKHTDLSLRNSSTGGGGTRRHHRMSTSSHFASSYFSQIFTGSTYFESEYGGLTDSLTMSSRRRESSRSHQPPHSIKRQSLLTGELIELYTPRASLAPHTYHRYSRQASVPRGGLPSIVPARPLYVSPSTSPYSQSSIHSQATGRQQSPSPHIFRPSRSPSPRSLAPVTSIRLLRPCYSAPRLHVPFHRITGTNIKPSETLFEETAISVVQPAKKTVVIIQRQNAIVSNDEFEQPSSSLSAATRRTMLKETTIESGEPVWLKRSNSS